MTFLRALALLLHVIERWLGDTFREALLDGHPIARAGTVAIERDPWLLVDEVLASPTAPDVLVIAGGRLLEMPPPRSLAALQPLMNVGIGLCLRHTERCHAHLRAIADAFERDVGETQVQMFVTPRNTHGFGWHFDDEDVFIAQLAGVKDYYFRANTIAQQPAHPPAFAKFTDETSPLATATLVAGDFLYLPARWWHVALCQEAAVSVSVGVRRSPACKDRMQEAYDVG